MPVMEVDSKAFKSTVTQSRKLSEQSGARRSTIMLRGDRPEFIALNDHTQFHVYLKGTVSQTGTALTINPEALSSFKPRAKTVGLAWDDNSVLKIQDGKTKYQLKLGVSSLEPADPGLSAQLTLIPGKILSAIREAVSLPYAFHKADASKLPVQLSSKEGRLCVQANDGYTLVVVDTAFPYLGEPIKVPLYLLDIFASDSTDVRISPSNYQLQVQSDERRLIASTLDEAEQDHSAILDQMEDISVSFEFDAAKLAQEIAPLTDLLDSKEKSSSIIVLQATPERFSLHMSHKELGQVDQEELESISKPYLERSLQKVTINLHPKAFLAYTELVAGLKVPVAKAFCAQRCVYYEAQPEWGRVRYVFPTVQV